MIKKLYSMFCKVELWACALMLASIASLVFFSAILRTFGRPINWAEDISLLLFAWLVFIGGDVVIRENKLISVDMFLNKLPSAWRTALNVLFYIAMLAFLYFMVRYGFQLLMTNRRRMFMSTNLSYSWCTLSVPVGSILMAVSILIRLVKTIRHGADSLGPSAAKELA